MSSSQPPLSKDLSPFNFCRHHALLDLGTLRCLPALLRMSTPSLGDSFLLFQSVSAGTRDVYLSAFQRFSSWIQQQRSLSQLPIATTPLDLDCQLQAYIHMLFRGSATRGNRQLAVNTLCAIVFLDPLARNALPLSRRCLLSWEKLIPPNQSMPASSQVTYALVAHFFSLSLPQPALITWLSFDAYLRVSEVCSLQQHHVILQGQDLVISLPKSKTGRNQAVLLQHPVLVCLLRFYISRLPSLVSPLFTVTPAHFRASLTQAAVALHLPQHLRITPHSFRHGGATYDFISKNRTLAEITQRGRWASEKSTRRYLQAARALVLTASLPKEVYDLGTHWRDNSHLWLPLLSQLFVCCSSSSLCAPLS